MDEIIDQLNNTKRLFIIMILAIMIIPPIVFVISFELLVPPNIHSFDEGTHYKNGHREGYGGIPRFHSMFPIIRHIPLIIGLIWLGIGIRQWIVLSKWSKKYQKYKELQKKIDEKMDNKDDLE
jgi:hypothetical protein